MSKRMSIKEQDNKIELEKARLFEGFKGISDEKKELAKSLIERAAFMAITLDLLEEDIKDRGATYLFEQGKQKMIIENPSQKSYNTMINRYTTVINRLIDLLPKEDEFANDPFEDFLKRADEK